MEDLMPHLRRRDSAPTPRVNRREPVFARFVIACAALHFARQGGVALTHAQSVAWLVQLVVLALALATRVAL